MNRRRFLRSLTALALGSAALGTSACGRRDATTVTLMAAGSLNNAFENGLASALPDSLRLEIEAHGSATVARMIAEGQRDPDVVTLADVALFDGPLHPAWFVEFATNALVLAYNSDTDGGRVLAEAGPDAWFEPLLDGAVRAGRTDPDEDPLGYRTLMMLELASAHYGTDVDLRDAIPTQDQIYPETGLISQFETGSIDVAFAYRNMAAERDYAWIDLPAAIDLSDPRHADTYATTSYTLPSGKTVTGGVIRYGTTLRHVRDATLQVLDAQCTGRYLHTFGFTVPDDFPRFHGDLPLGVQRLRERLSA